MLAALNRDASGLLGMVVTKDAAVCFLFVLG